MILIILIPVISGLLVGTILTNDFNGSKSNTLENTCNERKVNNNRYISEYLIPDSCSAPIAITTDNNGIVWFIQNNNSKQYQTIIKTQNLGVYYPQMMKFGLQIIKIISYGDFINKIIHLLIIDLKHKTVILYK